jgi:hypothetical protein
MAKIEIRMSQKYNFPFINLKLDKISGKALSPFLE